MSSMRRSTSRTPRSVSPLQVGLLVLLGIVPLPSVEAQDTDRELATLRERVAKLEVELGTLMRDYGDRLAALEDRVAAMAAAPGPGSEGRPETASALTETERSELESDLAAILGETGGEAVSSGESVDTQLPAGGERRFTGRERTLTELNPEISVAADVFGTMADSPESNKFEINEFELAFQSPLDPFSLAKAFVVQEGEEFGVEEAFIDWVSLPGGLGLKVGQYRNDWGKLNRWHNHALPQTQRPLAHQALLGEEGLGGLGVSFSWLPPAFLGDYNEIWFQITNDTNETAFSGRGFDEPILLIHETNYWDLSDAAYIEVGLSAATGVNDPLGEYRTQLFGIDWNFDWRPPATALYKGLELRGELILQRREQVVGALNSWGMYTFATYKLNRKWFAGVRADWTQLPEEPGAELWGVSPYVEWWQSEWARLRLQYSYASRQLESSESENRLFFQVTWALGPHKHEKY